MTREEAISQLISLNEEDVNVYSDAVEYAIKALEQTSAIDRVREEIAAYGSIHVQYIITGYTDHDIDLIVEDVLKQAKEQVLAVIDEYRAESENKE